MDFYKHRVGITAALIVGTIALYWYVLGWWQSLLIVAIACLITWLQHRSSQPRDAVNRVIPSYPVDNSDIKE